MTSFRELDQLSQISSNAFRSSNLAHYVLYIPKKCSYIAAGAFGGTKISGLIFLNEVLCKIQSSVFEGCSSFYEVDFNTSLQLQGFSVYGNHMRTARIWPNVQCCANCFAFNYNLNNITFIGESNYNYMDQNQVIYDLQKTTIVFYPTKKTEKFVCPNETTILGSASFGGTSLKEADFSSIITIQNQVFQNSAIETVLFRDLKGITGGSAFYQTKIKKIIFPEGFQSLVSNSCLSCLYLSYVYIPSTFCSFNGAPFSGCTSLGYLDISPNCTFLVLNNNDQVVYRHDMEMIFFVPNNLTVLYILPHMTRIPPSTFYGLSKICHFIFLGNITSIEGSAFAYCSSLLNMTLPSSLKSLSTYVFNGCTSLQNLTFSDGCTVKSIPGNLCFGCISLKCCNFGTTPISTIGASAFYNCKFLGNLILPETVESIGDMAFYNCITFTEITLHGTVPITISYNAFSLCDNLKKLNVDTIKISPLCFRNLNGFETITFSSTLEEIGSSAFSDCSNIKNLIFSENEQPTLTIPKLQIGSNAFAYCISLEEVLLPSTLVSITASVFTGCSSLMTVRVNDANRFETSNGLLYEKGRETLILCPAGLESAIVSNQTKILGKQSFQGCLNLRSIYLSYNLQTISDFCFYKCSNLRTLNIPIGIQYIGEKPFHECDRLKYISYCGTDDKGIKTFENNNPFPMNLQFLVSKYYLNSTFLGQRVTKSMSVDQYSCPNAPSILFSHLKIKKRRFLRTKRSMIFFIARLLFQTDS